MEAAVNPTVLLIDDSASVRLEARRALEPTGFTILEACDGLEGLERLEKSDVALIVCDVNMPRMGGLEFLEALVLKDKKPPVLMLTTEAHPQMLQRAKASGAKGWIVKPFKPELLVAAAKKITKK